MSQSSLPTELDARRELGCDFRLESQVARGATAFAYRARDRADRAVVVTAIARTGVTAPAPEEEVRRAGEATVELSHAAIIPLCGWGATPSFLWYSTQDTGGRSLADRLHSEVRLPVHECLRVLEEVGGALDYAHQRGVPHGGLTAASVIMHASGRVLVADFRVAALLAGGEPTPENDQYALAALVYQCITGDAGPRDAPATLRDARPDVPPQLCEALSRSLRREPAERFPTVRDFVAAAHHGGPVPKVLWLSRGLPGPSDAPPVIFDVEPEPARVGGRRAVVAGLGLALVTVGVWLAAASARGARPAVAEPSGPAPSVSQTAAPIPAAPPVVPQPAAPPPPPPPRPPAPPRRRVDSSQPGRLSINATPWGVVFIDGREVGNTPLLNLALSPGLHRLRVERPGFQAAERLVHLQPGKGVRVTDIVLREVTP